MSSLTERLKEIEERLEIQTAAIAAAEAAIKDAQNAKAQGCFQTARGLSEFLKSPLRELSQAVGE